MEPILSSKTENSGLLKKLIETIKQTKDAQSPDDEDANEVRLLNPPEQNNQFTNGLIILQ